MLQVQEFLKALLIESYDDFMMPVPLNDGSWGCPGAEVY